MLRANCVTHIKIVSICLNITSNKKYVVNIISLLSRRITMVEQNQEFVNIVTWPERVARFEHFFNSEKPCPISIFIEKEPLNVNVSSSSEQPLSVNMNMDVKVKESIPVCFKLCEPICAKSEYTVSFDIFDKPFASLMIRGQTKLFSCQDEYDMQGRHWTSL